jgi:hypothetical protein
MNIEHKAEKHICSICGKEYEGYGNNAQPVNNSKCCNECNYSVVIPIRMYTNCLQEIINNGESEVFEVKSKSYADVTYYYIKGKQVITDFKKMFVRDITLKKLKSTIKKLDALYCYTYLFCDYNYMSNLYKEQI